MKRVIKQVWVHWFIYFDTNLSKDLFFIAECAKLLFHTLYSEHALQRMRRSFYFANASIRNVYERERMRKSFYLAHVTIILARLVWLLLERTDKRHTCQARRSSFS